MLKLRTNRRDILYKSLTSVTTLIATTSTNLAYPIISLSVIKTFDNLFWEDKKMISLSEN